MCKDYTGVVGIVYLGEFEKFALIRNFMTGSITFPGGSREEGEDDPIMTLKREIKKETGLEENEYEIIETGLVHEFIFNSKKQDKTGRMGKNVVYLIKVNRDNLNPEDITHKALGWFDEGYVYKKVSFLDLRNVFLRVMELVSR